MSTIPEVKSQKLEKTSLGSHVTIPVKKLPVENIFSNIQSPIITDPIDPKRVFKFTNNLTAKSAVKAMLVFVGTIGTYYLAKTTGIFSFLGLKAKNPNLKEVVNSEIMEVKTTENSLSLKTNLETARQANNPSINRIAQTYKTEDRAVKFEEIKIEEFENFQKIEKQENLRMQKSFSRRSINIQNPIPNQNATVGELFELTIEGSDVFNSINSSLSLEATNIPSWLMLTPLNPNPTFKGSYDTPGDAYGVILSGNYAYVADQDSGLQIIDIRNPSNPTFKGSYDISFVNGITVSGSYAYVAGEGGLQVIDITDPVNPTFKSSYDTLYTPQGAVVSGNYAYVVVAGGLQIIDISDPSNPTFKGSYDTFYPLSGIAVSGNYAYVGVHGARYGSGLQIIDISDPSNPTSKGFYSTFYPLFTIAVSGNYGCVNIGDSGLQIVDISDPSNPTSKGFYDMPRFVAEVALSGNYAYVADYGSGLQIIDISNTSNPTFESSYDTPGYAKGVALFGNYAYVADGSSGLQIIALNPDEIRMCKR
jgi:hypothetical protein